MTASICRRAGWAENCLMELEMVRRVKRTKKAFDGCSSRQVKSSWNARCFVPVFHPAEKCNPVFRQPVSDEVDCALDFEYESLFELNHLCQTCAEFQDADFEKLSAVCQMAKPVVRRVSASWQKIWINSILHRMPTRRRNSGKYMIQRSRRYEYDEKLKDFYNYDDYGVKKSFRKGTFVDRGYVSYHGTLTLDELMQDDPAEKYQQEQEAKMEGMTW